MGIPSSTVSPHGQAGGVAVLALHPPSLLPPQVRSQPCLPCGLQGYLATG